MDTIIPEGERKFSKNQFIINENFNNLNLIALNSDITLQFTNRQDVCIELIYMKKEIDFVPQVVVKDNTIIVKADYTLTSDLKIVATLPQKHLEKIELKTVNGNILVLGAYSDVIQLVTKNGSITFTGSTVDAYYETVNGKIELNLSNVNSNIMNWKAFTSNGSIFLNLPTQEVYLVLKEKNSKNYHYNTKNYYGLSLIKSLLENGENTIELGKPDAETKINFEVATSNGSLIIG